MRRALGLVVASAIAIPAGAQPRSEPLNAFLQRQFADAREHGPDSRYAIAWANLDGDPRPEALIYMQGRYWCGSGGCNLLVVRAQYGSWRIVSEIRLARPPILVLDTRNRGWRDLAVSVSGGGIQPGYQARLRFDGRTYPSNPTLDDVSRLSPGESGRIVIRQESATQRLF
jgi:hypothetical protein